MKTYLFSLKYKHKKFAHINIDENYLFFVISIKRLMKTHSYKFKKKLTVFNYKKVKISKYIINIFINKYLLIISKF